MDTTTRQRLSPYRKDFETILDKNSIQTLPRPSMSPDLKAIEHLWDYVKCKLQSINLKRRNWAELYSNLGE